MMVSTMTEVPVSPHNKARTNSSDAGYNTNTIDNSHSNADGSSHHHDQALYYNDYALRQRASSSEAQLPSSSYRHHDNSPVDNGSQSSTITSYDSSNGNDSPTRTSQTKSSSGPLLQRHNSLNRSKSENTKRLQTIESGIALADSANNSPTPKPPLHPSNTINNGPSLPPLPQVDSLDTIDKSPPEKPDTIQRNSSHQSQHSSVSHYSVDAGKHGFINHSLNNNDDNDSIVTDGGDSANGSLVFKYLPGEETPPAEYALPASILRVYGVDCSDGYTQHGSGVYGAEEGKTNGNGMQWNPSRAGSERASYSSILFTPSSSSDEDEETGSGSPDGINQTSMPTKRIKNQPRGPPRSSGNNNSTALRIPHLMASAPSSTETSPDIAVRILPYHERKRLMELEEEEEKRRLGKNSKKNPSRNSKTVSKKTNKSSERENRDRGQHQQRHHQGRDSGKDRVHGEKTPLTGKQRSSGGYGTSSANTKLKTSDNNNDEQQAKGKGWFNQLLSTVTGKPASPSSPPTWSSTNDEQRDEEQQRAAHIQDETKSYRDRGRAFLAETERERKIMKEQMKLEELNSVMVPVAKKSFGHKVKMSSMSAALDSICDNSDEDETSCSSSDDEESGQYFRKDEQRQLQQQQHNNAKVWKYGDTPTTSTNTSLNTPKKKKFSSAQHDRIMKRERLLQEEYEFRLHSLKRENEKLSKKFRVFVLVTVACMFTGALAFAFVVCVRMLMSI